MHTETSTDPRVHSVNPMRVQCAETVERRSPQLGELGDSVRQHGVIQPPIVRELYSDPNYDFECVVGSRRLRAAQARYQEDSDYRLPVIAVDWDSLESQIASIVENIDLFREEVSPSDRTAAVKAVFEQKRKEDSTFEQRDLAELLGVSTRTLRDWFERAEDDWFAVDRSFKKRQTYNRPQRLASPSASTTTTNESDSVDDSQTNQTKSIDTEEPSVSLNSPSYNAEITEPQDDAALFGDAGEISTDESWVDSEVDAPDDISPETMGVLGEEFDYIPDRTLSYFRKLCKEYVEDLGSLKGEEPINGDDATKRRRRELRDVIDYLHRQYEYDSDFDLPSQHDIEGARRTLLRARENGDNKIRPVSVVKEIYEARAEGVSASLRVMLPIDLQLELKEVADAHNETVATTIAKALALHRQLGFPRQDDTESLVEARNVIEKQLLNTQ